MKETIEKTNSYQINHAKEVEWLNEMADRQKALVDAAMWKYKTDYTFESCSAGEYTFHIEFHPGATAPDCIAFMKGNGAELISDLPLGVRSNSMHKLYFRKHVDKGAFNQFCRSVYLSVSHDGGALFLPRKPLFPILSHDEPRQPLPGFILGAKCACINFARKGICCCL